MRPYRYPAVSPSSSSSFYLAGEEWQQRGARLTEKFQRHEKLLNGSLMLLVAAVRTRPPCFELPPHLPPSVSFTCPSFVFFPFLISSLSNISPFSRFDHSLVCMRAVEVSRLRSFYSWSDPDGICVYSRIKLDNKLPENQSDENRGR